MNKKKKDLLEIGIKDEYIYIVYHEQCITIKRVSDKDLVIKKTKFRTKSKTKKLDMLGNVNPIVNNSSKKVKVVDVPEHIGIGGIASYMSDPRYLRHKRVKSNSLIGKRAKDFSHVGVPHKRKNIRLS